MSGRLEHTVQVSKSGRSWVIGSISVLFSSSAVEWQRARDAGTVGEFYTNMAHKFIAKYGWDWKFKPVDKECPDPTPEQWAAVMDHTGLSEAEVAVRQEYYAKLRTVSATTSSITCTFNSMRQKIIHWYLTTYGQVQDTDNQNMEIQKMISKMAENLPPPPRKKQLVQYYQKEYFKTKGIKEFVARTWPAEEMKPVPSGVKKMQHLDYGNKITAEYFARETAKFKQQLTSERDEAFIKAMKNHQEKVEAMENVPETAESYHKSVVSRGVVQSKD